MSTTIRTKVFGRNKYWIERHCLKTAVKTDSELSGYILRALTEVFENQVSNTVLPRNFLRLVQTFFLVIKQ